MCSENGNKDLSVIKQVVALQNMRSCDLEAMWDKFFNHPPEVASRQHITAKLAYKIQEMAYGGVDSKTEEKIKSCAKEIPTLVELKKTRKFSLMVGTKITKEYHGKLHEVFVVKEGFSYNSEIYKSLSAIASKIAGTKWNGLKFFAVGGKK